MIERIYNILKHNDKRSSNSINTPTSEQSLACKDAEFVLLAIVFSTYVTLDICVRDTLLGQTKTYFRTNVYN